MVKGQIVQLLEIVEDDGTVSIGLGVVNRQGTLSHGRLVCEHTDGDLSRLQFLPDADIKVDPGQGARHGRGYARGVTPPQPSSVED